MADVPVESMIQGVPALFDKLSAHGPLLVIVDQPATIGGVTTYQDPDFPERELTVSLRDGLDESFVRAPRSPLGGAVRPR
ncbi:hypothetical protein [Qaidamihabitans albus]|uniref:hypothetical protein n=1 Tax=Qaidamihabitans albus TaxID=2795733 RepID=UPI0018F17BB7|nr:hypothetical protein [Qaidamihabitans albus]